MWLDENAEYFYNDTSYAFVLDEKQSGLYKFYLAILNSSLLWFFLKKSSSELRGGYFRFKTKFLEPFGLPKLSNLAEQEPFILRVDRLLELNKNLQNVKNGFLNELNLEKIPTKIQNFESLEFNEFISEFAKIKKIKFKNKLDEREFKSQWQKLFEADRAQAQMLKSQIITLNDELDKMVYELYGLNDDEIALLINSTNLT
ncbi:hypothetical protein KDE13_08950 [Campylobacter sp. faydin G-140]|uniref:TaqI-like C-terminal specificity domain-containing protein n=1 Tax=Campylobacter anatolicus TaxID=2829105 RepID=UPI001B8EE065|nr:TaqI-like C-terminal specificity domain-containing protein [Campylobacter anatolicus]MBR8466460.1 hypothetical protein [Campylobacter anatolicus]